MKGIEFSVILLLLVGLVVLGVYVLNKRIKGSSSPSKSQLVGGMDCLRLAASCERDDECCSGLKCKLGKYYSDRKRCWH